MITRNDMVAKFEAITKQEIKNYQDSHNFVLQSLRDIKNDIHETRELLLERYAQLHTCHNALAILLENHKLKQKEEKSEADFLIQNSATALSDLLDEVRRTQHSLAVLKNQYSNQNEKIGELHEKVEELRQAQEIMQMELRDSLRQMKVQFTSDLSQTKDAILSTPSPMENLYKLTHEKIEANKVNVDGIMKEIQSQKQADMIQDKKIEQLQFNLFRMMKGENK